MSSLLSDERLVRRATAGEERAFATIFDRYHQPLYRYCLAIVGNSQDAQDALQNTMLKVLRALPGEEREIKLKPWLYRIAHNESIDLLRRRRDTRELDAELAAPGQSVADELSMRERLRQLLSDLDQLPERQRGALVMRELAGLDFDGIAVALGTSPAVARQTLYEARLSLHQMDEGRGMDCTAVTQALSDGDGRVTRRRDVRAHLRSCSDCRRFSEEIDGRERDFAALAPLPAAAAAGLLQGLLGGGGPGAGTAAGAAVAGGAAKTLGSSAALKGAAAILAIAAVGTGVAERSGVIELGQPGGAGSKGAQTHQASDPATPSEPSTQRRRRPAAPGRGGAGFPIRLGQVSAKFRRSGAGRAARQREAPSAHGPVAGGGSQVTHPHGKGHEKQLPAAAAHGQQVAAAHKGNSHAAGSEEHPSHPVHPEHPSHPDTGQEKTPPEPKAVPPGKERAADEGAAGAPEAEPAEVKP